MFPSRGETEPQGSAERVLELIKMIMLISRERARRLKDPRGRVQCVYRFNVAQPVWSQRVIKRGSLNLRAEFACIRPCSFSPPRAILPSLTVELSPILAPLRFHPTDLFSEISLAARNVQTVVKRNLVKIVQVRLRFSEVIIGDVRVFFLSFFRPLLGKLKIRLTDGGATRLGESRLGEVPVPWYWGR